MIRARVLHGHVDCQSRMRREPDRWIGEGRALHYDSHGRLVRTTEWAPTGVELVIKPPARPSFFAQFVPFLWTYFYRCTPFGAKRKAK